MSGPSIGNLTLRHLVPGAMVAAVVWFVPGTNTVLTTKLTEADYAAWLKSGPVGDPPGKPDPSAVHLISGTRQALDTADGFPGAGDCWEGPYDDPTTGQVVTALHVWNGQDPACAWEYQCSNHPSLKQSITASSKCLQSLPVYNKANPAATAVVALPPSMTVNVAPPVASGVAHSWGTTPVNQAVGGWSSGTSYTVTVTAPTDGNSMRACCGCGGGTVTVSSISETGASWSLAKDLNQNAHYAGIFGADGVSGASTTVTVNLNTTGVASCTANVSEWAPGAGNTVTLDVATTNTNNASSQPSVAGTPVAGLNELILVATQDGSPAQTGPSGGFTALTAGSGAANAVFSAYQVVASTTGTYTATWPSNANAWTAIMCSWKSVAAAGGAPLRRNSSLSGLGASGGFFHDPLGGP